MCIVFMCVYGYVVFVCVWSCVYVCILCVGVCLVCACSQRTEENVRSPEAGAIGSIELPVPHMGTVH